MILCVKLPGSVRRYFSGFPLQGILCPSLSLNFLFSRFQKRTAQTAAHCLAHLSSKGRPAIVCGQHIPGEFTFYGSETQKIHGARKSTFFFRIKHHGNIPLCLLQHSSQLKAFSSITGIQEKNSVSVEQRAVILGEHRVQSLLLCARERRSSCRQAGRTQSRRNQRKQYQQNQTEIEGNASLPM